MNCKPLSIALLAICSTLAVAFADPAPDQISSSQPPSGTGTNKQADEALDKTLVSIAPATPFQFALQQIAVTANITLNINWKAMDDAGAFRNARISVPLNQVTAREALRATLATNTEIPLAFLVDNHQVLISTRDDLRRRFQQTKVFDVSALTADFEPHSAAALDFDRNLLNTLTTTLEPKTWGDNGGTLGTAHIVNQQLIVTQSYDVMPAVEELITQLTKNPRTSTHTYDVQDLLAGSPPPDALGHGKREDLITAIQSSCGRDTWRNPTAEANGTGTVATGKTSSIAPFDNKLVITTTPAVHQQIESLLALLRKKD